MGRGGFDQPNREKSAILGLGRMVRLACIKFVIFCLEPSVKSFRNHKMISFDTYVVLTFGIKNLRIFEVFEWDFGPTQTEKFVYK
jgi:hypothetical protein